MGISEDDGISGRYVVDYAEICCDQAKKGENYLRIPCEGCGIVQKGGMNAHKKSCVPYENIAPFPECHSPKYIEVLSELLEAHAPQAEAHRAEYEKYLKEAKKNKANGKNKGTCILALLDEWFDPDEKMVVEENISLLYQIRDAMEGPSGIRLGSIERDIESILSSLIREKTLEGRIKCKWNVETVGDLQIEMNALLSDQRDLYDNIYLITDTDDSRAQSDLQKLSDNVNKLMEGVEIIKALLKKDADQCNTALEKLDDCKDKIDARITALQNWEKKTYTLITTDSFLVCRCGGFITFLSSGQDDLYYEKNLLDRLIELIEKSIEIHKSSYEGFLKLNDPEEAKVFEKAIGQFEFLKQYVVSSAPNGSSEVPIFIENICKSYKDEVTNIIMGVLSLAAMLSGAPTPQQLVAIADFSRGIPTLLSVIDKDDENDSSNKDVSITGLSTESDVTTVLDTFGKVSKTASQLNTGLGTLLAVGNFFYVSDQTWIEEMRITMFVKDLAFVSIQHLDENGEQVNYLDSEMGFTDYKIKYYDKSTYDTYAGSVKWSNEAGIKTEKHTHMAIGTSEDN